MTSKCGAPSGGRTRRCAAAALIAVALAAAPVAAQQPAAPAQPAPAPGAQIPGVPGVPGARPQAVAPAPTAIAARVFTAPVGLLFNTVRPDKTADFEKLVAAVRAALEASTDPAIQSLAKGLRFYKASEPGPGNSVLYVFIADPAVPGEDYGLGRILSQGSTDTDAAALQETWKLYTSSVTGGGSLLNLTPVPEAPAEPTPDEKPAGTVEPASETAKPGEKPAAPSTQKP